MAPRHRVFKKNGWWLVVPPCEAGCEHAHRFTDKETPRFSSWHNAMMAVRFSRKKARSGCAWVAVEMDLRVPVGSPKPTTAQWNTAAKILGAQGFTHSNHKQWKVFNHDGSNR